MPPGNDVCEGLREEFIRLLEDVEYSITETACGNGNEILRSHRGHLGECAIVEFILEKLHGNFPLHAVELGSGETGCVMNTQLPDGRPLYIKLKIENEEAVVLSFHVSKHS